MTPRAFALYGAASDALVYRYPAHPDTLTAEQARAALQAAQDALRGHGCSVGATEGGGRFVVWHGEAAAAVWLEEVRKGE